MAIEWSARARADIRGLQAYIAKDSLYYARQFVERILGVVETLVVHPRIGRPVPEANRDDIRELIFQGYRIIYLEKTEHVYIVTVLHGSRDLAGQTSKPWDDE
jgi:plasmid stabilization system protein ParE